MFNRASYILYLLFLIVTLSLIAGIGGTLKQSEAQNTSEKILTNNDIISLVKAGLSDKAIISVIQKSQSKFDLTPEILIELKKVGVSNKVIEVMVGGRSSGVSESKVSLVPTTYGYYAIDEGWLVKLETTSVVTKLGLEIGGRSGLGYAMDGLGGEPPLSLRDQSPTFIVYQQNVNINSLHLSDLVFVSTKQAYQFNIKGTAPQFFSNVYGGRGYYDVIDINLWRPKNEVSLRIEPVEGKQGMYKLIPELPLKPGRYTLYFEGAIHPYGTVFVATRGEQRSVFHFRID